MALQVPYTLNLTYQDPQLLTVFPDLADKLMTKYLVPAAYVRVMSYRRHGDTMKVSVTIYANDQCAAIVAHADYQVPYDRRVGNPVTVIYQYLKTLPVYAGAVDV